MCLAVYKPKGTTLSDIELRAGWAANPDGAGMMWASGGELFVKKGYMKLKVFIAAFRRYEALYPSSDFVLHFRFCTHGTKGAHNTHPFRIRDLGYVHNGILSGYNDPVKSDTALFAERILAELPSGFLGQPGIVKLLGSVAKESGSKFVFLDNFGKVTILNEEAGEWVNGVWYSVKSPLSIMDATYDLYAGAYTYDACCFFCGQKSEIMYAQDHNSKLVCPECDAYLKEHDSAYVFTT